MLTRINLKYLDDKSNKVQIGWPVTKGDYGLILSDDGEILLLKQKGCEPMIYQYQSDPDAKKMPNNTTHALMDFAGCCLAMHDLNKKYLVIYGKSRDELTIKNVWFTARSKTEIVMYETDSLTFSSSTWKVIPEAEKRIDLNLGDNDINKFVLNTDSGITYAITASQQLIDCWDMPVRESFTSVKDIDYLITVERSKFIIEKIEVTNGDIEGYCNIDLTGYLPMVTNFDFSE